MQSARQLLKKFWGHESFRPLQEEIISAAGKEKDIIALLPTGGGKSICFQIPALLTEGICIIISPLVALMQDQVKALQAKGIKALAITGGIPLSELDTLLDNCIYGNYKFLYLSPERLQQDLVQERIRRMNVNLIAVDEAHCISQWGHDFRPSYLNISVLRQLQPKASVMAVTASATKAVIDDIATQLKMNDPLVFQNSLERKNISLQVLLAEDKMYKTKQLLQNQEESAIIYVRNRRATYDITQELRRQGYTATDFHGGLTSKEKVSRLESWLKNETRIMVATNAFGMGIDKPDVRHVIHLNLPESIESYFQEAGRAGRDGHYSTATIITNRSDIPLLKNQFLKTLPDVASVILVYKKLSGYFQIAYGEGTNTVHDFNFADFCSRYELNSVKTYNILQLLDRISIIRLSQQFQQETRIRFLVSNNQLLFFLRENQGIDSIVKTFLRTYGGIFENKISVNLALIAKKAEVNETVVNEVLKRLERDRIIELEQQLFDATITFLVPREDETSIYPFSNYIKKQALNKTEKIESLLAYVENDQVCRSIQLLAYFGDKKTSKCGICSVCKPLELKLTREEIKKVYNEIILFLENGERSSREMVAALNFSETWILKVLELLLEKQIITLTGANTYKLKHL